VFFKVSQHIAVKRGRITREDFATQIKLSVRIRLDFPFLESDRLACFVVFAIVSVDNSTVRQHKSDSNVITLVA